MNLDTVINHEHRLKQRAYELHSRVRSFQCTFDEYLKMREKMIHEYPAWKKLPRYVHARIHGMLDVMYEQLVRHVLGNKPPIAFAYEYKGEVLLTHSKKYKKISPRLISEKATAGGTVWADTLKPWSFKTREEHAVWDAEFKASYEAKQKAKRDQ